VGQFESRWPLWGLDVSIERIYFCDAPECEGHVRTAAVRPHGMIFATDTAGLAARRTLHFCSWDCVLRFAAGQPAVEVSPVGRPSWGGTC
jgi:hypothetical protein